MNESSIERSLGKQLAKMGCLYMKFVSPGNVGVPDRIIVLPGGRILFAELKAEDGKLHPLQFHQINRLRKLGCEVRLVYGREEARELAEEIGRMLHGV